jgi:hypothetical protein
VKILIEIHKGIVQNVWSEEPNDTQIVVRDLDNIEAGDPDPMSEDPGLAELRTPHFVIY